MFGICSDTRITKLANEGMIRPFHEGLVSKGTISYGLSSYGYDLRLSCNSFKVFQHIPGEIVDPKNFNPGNLVPVQLNKDENGHTFFIMPGHSYGLGVAVEELNIPSNMMCLCIGKSTYARAGLIANLTPVEAGWCGHLTIEISNSAASDCKVYANEGIIQVVFFENLPCQTDYAMRNGKYQGQDEQITLPKVES